MAIVVIDNYCQNAILAITFHWQFLPKMCLHKGVILQGVCSDGGVAASFMAKNVDQRIKDLELNIENIQPQIDGLREEKFVFEKQYRQFEAEVGPVKYIAQLIYGDNPDQNLLEAAVRWVIILIVAVFDPLAIMMLLAATETFAWRRQEKETAVETVTTMPSPVPVEKAEEVQAEEEPEPIPSDTDGPADEEPSETRSEDKSDGGESLREHKFSAIT